MWHHKLVFITGGKGKVVIGEKKYSFKKGSLIYYSPDWSNSIEIDTEEPIHFLSVLFDYVNVVLSDEKYCIANDVKTLPLQPVQNLIGFCPGEMLFENLGHSWNAKLPGYEFISKTLLQ
jgi:hypothetical protein